MARRHADKRHPTRERRSLGYPKDGRQPKDWMRFVQLDQFKHDWSDLKLDDDDLRALEVCIMGDPDGPPVIEATGGARKLRFASNRWTTGKRGGVRIVYVHFPEKGVIVLLAAYGKVKKDTLTAREKQAVKSLIDRIHRCFTDGVN